MAGIYIHIPFCKQACNYCNFYFVTGTNNRDKFLSAVMKEIEITQNYLSGEEINTLYFGGGTPSLLAADEIKIIIDKISSLHKTNFSEITIECNPDDLDCKKLKDYASLQQYGLNRFSIGVQSFHEKDLRFMNRAHSSAEAAESIKRSQDAGFENITIDLIYGTPGLSNELWMENLETAYSLKVNHLSCYALTLEPKTKLNQLVKKKQVEKPDSDQASAQFNLLMKFAAEKNFIHYEISNFAKPGKAAIHNSGYWKGEKYLGLGPSAHSYDLKSRRWNVANLKNYINSIANGEKLFEEELLSKEEKENEYIMTSLRTNYGCDLNKLDVAAQKRILTVADTFNKEWFTLHNNCLSLTNSGKHFADYIASELFTEK